VIAAPRLEGIVAGSELVSPVRRLAANGLAAWKQVVERGYEGYVAKDEASVYRLPAILGDRSVRLPDLEPPPRRPSMAAADLRG
jgi:hypothetical protein